MVWMKGKQLMSNYFLSNIVPKKFEICEMFGPEGQNSFYDLKTALLICNFKIKTINHSALDSHYGKNYA